MYSIEDRYECSYLLSKLIIWAHFSLDFSYLKCRFSSREINVTFRFVNKQLIVYTMLIILLDIQIDVYFTEA